MLTKEVIILILGASAWRYLAEMAWQNGTLRESSCFDGFDEAFRIIFKVLCHSKRMVVMVMVVVGG